MKDFLSWLALLILLVLVLTSPAHPIKTMADVSLAIFWVAVGYYSSAIWQWWRNRRKHPEDYSYKDHWREQQQEKDPVKQ